MATVVFAGETIWNDNIASTGRGALLPQIQRPVDQISYEPIPRGNGVVGKIVGVVPGRVALPLMYVATDSAFNSIVAALQALDGTEGALVIGGKTSIPYCILVSILDADGQPLRRAGSSDELRERRVFLDFTILRKGS